MFTIVTPLMMLMPLGADDKPAPKVPVGKETTFVTGPLDKDGYLDFEAALNERLRKSTTPEKNANVLLMKAIGPKPEGALLPPEYYKELGISEPPEKGDYMIGLGKHLRENLKLQANEMQEVFDQQSRASRRPWTIDLYPHLGSWIILNEKPLNLVVEACKRPDYYNPLVTRRLPDGKRDILVTALLPTVQRYREFASAMTARAMLRLSEGKTAEAWQDILACHQLARKVATGATLIEMLVGIAIDAIATGSDLVYLERANLTPKQLRECLKDLQALPPMPHPADKVDLSERLVFLDCVQAVRRRGSNTLADLIDVSFRLDPKDEKRVAEKIDLEPAFRAGILWYDRLAKAMRIEDRTERLKSFELIEAELKALKKADVAYLEKGLAKLAGAGAEPDKRLSKALANMLVAALIPATTKVQAAYERSIQIRRNREVAFALALYRIDNQRYPAKLDDLAPKYLAKIPADLFSGKALIYHRSDNGYLFYSVGANGKDEQGRWYDDEPPGDDPNVRMPLPELKARR
jgi:hypothetical protein